MNTYARNSDPTDSPSPSSVSDSTPTLLPQTLRDDNLTTPKYDSPSPQTCTPRIVGKYAILEEVQVGGMGIVYKAHDTELDRIVALKMIKGGLLATAEEIARFRHEARAAARLDHPNIVPVYDIGQEEGRIYFTMAFAQGGSLAQHRDRFAADPRAAAALLEKIARAVHHAHEKNILHRDLKPGNILFDERGTPWVGDFGLAKFVDGSLELTRPGQMLGTPAYMAPEQAAGHTDQISPRTDVWALGVLLYELLTGQRPFKGVSQEEQFHKVRTAEPPRPRTINRALDRALETVILKCLEKEPAQRYVSAEAVADDLARWLRGEPVLARPPSWLVRAGRAMRRYRTLALCLVLAAVLLVLLFLARKDLSPSVPREEPDDPKQLQAMEEQLARLRKGETVALIGESGLPLGSRWQLRQTETLAKPEKDQSLHIHAVHSSAMLELLPAAPPRFRLRALVQHCKGDHAHGQVGIYFAHGKRHTAIEIMHCFFRVAFNDRMSLPKQAQQERMSKPANNARLTLVIGRDRRTIFSQCKTECGVSLPFTPAGKLESMPWRSLVVEVTPERIKTIWERKAIKTFWNEKEAEGCDPRTALAKAIEAYGKLSSLSNPDVRPVFDEKLTLSLGEGIGLYVERGSAAFRSVVIEPLP